MHASSTCIRETLANGPICRVDRCACGMLHLTVGPMTVRLDAESCLSISCTLQEALRVHHDSERVDRRALI